MALRPACQFDCLLLPDQLDQSRAQQHLLDTVLGLLKKSAEGAAIGVFAIGFKLLATLENDLSLDGFNDFQDGDFCGMLDQRKSAARTPNGSDQPGFGQVLKNLGEKTLRNPLRSAYL